jgi:hypothetical protein
LKIPAQKSRFDGKKLVAWSRLMDSGRARNQVVPLWEIYRKTKKTEASCEYHPNKGKDLGPKHGGKIRGDIFGRIQGKNRFLELSRNQV